MVAPKTTIWKLDPHTSAKHAILRRYLQAWAPILAKAAFPSLLTSMASLDRDDTREARMAPR